MVVEIDRANEAFERCAWDEAYEELSTLAAQAPLPSGVLHRLASAAYLSGREAESYELWSQGHRDCVRAGDIPGAVRHAFWLADRLAFRGDLAQSGGWVDRARRLLDGANLDCVEQGYLDYAAAMRHVLRDGNVAAAHDAFIGAAKIGDRFRDVELATLARIGEGRCLIYLGEARHGLALLDEAMVAVVTGEIPPVAVGDAYCAVLDACHELFDVRRLAEWSAAFTDWCDSQPALVLFRGHCLLHRAELLQLHGEWAEAIHEAQRACARLAEPTHPAALGAARYLLGELHRLRGEFAEAQDAYRQANEAGYEPQPGLALLRLAQGGTEAALASIQRVLAQAEHPVARARVLGPYVEIALAASDVHDARTAADEMNVIAGQLSSPFLTAAAENANGAVLLAQDDPRSALVPLRRAWRTWAELHARHHAARTRVLIASACRALGDEEGAALELSVAASTLRELGAAPDLAAIQPMPTSSKRRAVDGLTRREIEVLALVAAGKTNRAIAEVLVISEKTVASHLSHIFTKLGLSSRAAATAHAYEHDLL